MMRAPLVAACVAAALCLCRAPSRPAEAGTVVRMELEQLARSAELVFEGRVLAKRAYRDEHGSLRTEFTVSVSRSFAGEPQGTRTFELPGGELPDGSGLLIPGMPTLSVGEDLLLFLTRASSTGLRVPVGLAQGKLRLVRDGLDRPALLRENADLTLLDPRTGAGTPAPIPVPLAYEAVVERIVEALREPSEER